MLKQKYLDIVTILSPDGYYARTAKERHFFKELEREKKVKKRSGSKYIYVLPYNLDEKTLDDFLQRLQTIFSRLRSSYKPFVAIGEIKEEFKKRFSITESEFDISLLKLYENGIVDLEQSLTNNDNQNQGILSKTGKIFQYILAVN